MDTTYNYQTHYSGGGIGIVPMIIFLAIMVFVIASMWKTFAKAGKPGWAAIVPIYNLVVMCEIAGKPPWYIVLIFIPFVGGLIFSILVSIGIANAFGKSSGFGIGLALLSFVFYPILGFGSAQYVGPGGMGASGGMGMPGAGGMRAY